MACYGPKGFGRTWGSWCFHAYWGFRASSFFSLTLRPESLSRVKCCFCLVPVSSSGTLLQSQTHDRIRMSFKVFLLCPLHDLLHPKLQPETPAFIALSRTPINKFIINKNQQRGQRPPQALLFGSLDPRP